MAWIQKTSSGTYHIAFRFGGKKYKRSLKTKSRETAIARKTELEETLRIVDSGWLKVPSDCDVPSFLLSKGKAVNPRATTTRPARAKTALTISSAFNYFIAALPDNSLQSNTIRTLRIHQRHFERKLGVSFKLKNVDYSCLTHYVAERAKDPGKNDRQICGSTIKKEIVSLSAVRKWAVSNQFLEQSDFPKLGTLRFPIDTFKPSFQPFSTIERQTQAMEANCSEAKTLWESVFLNHSELDQLLNDVRSKADQHFVYPMFVLAAHTGARRSEILRSRIQDIDGDWIKIRERKRKKGAESYRSVPLSTYAKQTLNDWLIIYQSTGRLLSQTSRFTFQASWCC